LTFEKTGAQKTQNTCIQSKLNTWDRSRKHEKWMRKSLTVTITLSPNTCDDPKTQKTSYRSSPHSIAAAVAKLHPNRLFSGPKMFSGSMCLR